MLIAIVNTKGGVGKSTLAVHLSAWLHEQGVRTALLDADEQASSSQWLSQAAPQLPLYRVTSSVEVLRLAPQLIEKQEVVVADAPAALDARAAALLSVADVALVPILPSMLDVWASFRTARLIYRLQFHPKRRGLPRAMVVLNRVQSRTRLARIAAEAVARYGFAVSPISIEARQAYVEACARGTVVSRLPGANAARAEIDAWARHLFGWAEQLGVLTPTFEGRIIAQRSVAAQDVPILPPASAAPGPLSRENALAGRA